jgi:predicted amidophosphoribosyltransferase
MVGPAEGDGSGRTLPRTLSTSGAAAGRESGHSCRMRGIVRQRFDGWLSVAGDLLLGAECPGCGAARLGLCTGCRTALAGSKPHRTTPIPPPAGFPPTVTAGPYDQLLRNLISAHKERQAWMLTPVLAEQLARATVELLRDAPPEVPVYLVPVPSSPKAVRDRGRDATAAITAAAVRRLKAGRVGRPVSMIKLLRPVRRLADQSGLTAEQRHANLAGAYAVRSASIGSEPGLVIIVDDLVTTGSSLTEAARAIRDAGLTVLGATVIAATIRRLPRRSGPEVVLDRT